MLSVVKRGNGKGKERQRNKCAVGPDSNEARRRRRSIQIATTVMEGRSSTVGSFRVSCTDTAGTTMGG